MNDGKLFSDRRKFFYIVGTTAPCDGDDDGDDDDDDDDDDGDGGGGGGGGAAGVVLLVLVVLVVVVMIMIIIMIMILHVAACPDPKQQYGRCFQAFSIDNVFDHLRVHLGVGFLNTYMLGCFGCFPHPDF